MLTLPDLIPRPMATLSISMKSNPAPTFNDSQSISCHPAKYHCRTLRQRWLGGSLGFLALTAALQPLAAQNSNYSWIPVNSTATDDFAAASNWSGGIVPPNDGTANLSFGLYDSRILRTDYKHDTPNLASSYSVNALSFASGASTSLSNGAYHFTTSNNSNLTIGAGGLFAGGSSQTFSLPVILGASTTFTYSSGTSLTFDNAAGTGQLVLNANNLTLDVSAAGASLAGNISGNGGVIIANTNSSVGSTMTFASANSYAGGTTITREPS